MAFERKNAGDANESLPIWMAALLASCCRATGNGEQQLIDWQCVNGRAVYTNSGAEPEVVEPFGIPLGSGETVAVSWQPGETSYTVKLCDAATLAA